MTLKEIVTNIVEKIDNYGLKSEYSFSDLITTRSGEKLIFGEEVRKEIDLFLQIIKENHTHQLSNFSYQTLYSICRDSICDLYTEGVLHQGIKNGGRDHIKKLKEEIAIRIKNETVVLKHHFQADTCLFPNSPPVQIGPINILSNFAWARKINLHHHFFKFTFNSEGDEKNWREQLITLLESNGNSKTNNNIAITLYEIIKKSNSIIEIEIENYEPKLSRQLAKIASQAGLDCFSLIFGNNQMFTHQNLYERPNPPVSFDSLISFSGELISPGKTLTSKVLVYNGDEIDKIISENKNFIVAAGNIINSVVNKVEHPYKNLALRWTTSLNWYAEAQREQDDAISLAKIGISLDILSGGGTTKGILEMVKNILELDDQHIVIDHPQKTTLKEFIIDLYEYGRSQIVHGNHIDRLKSFEGERKKASLLNRVILIRLALNLLNYTGEDTHDAFVNMITQN
ncbi:HEPN domain-containing protein [Xenorhabdus sp. PB30.3]|uniref:HEPN domain-containing protein n=1 Tax=Xenorhabdus sp. PB30.3 TaxID=2788941 RepID=UPI001E45134A|nr:HEPN domain-containing protein [Xenorhabdus sp. PB30.3]MCC8380211.1 hypothetical protein [Xenorhabdus sp. PB30.3]